MKRRITGLLIVAAALLLTACEAAVTPNEHRDYTPPKILAMYPSEYSSVFVPSNASFYIQFDDRMDPAIAAYDSDALILEDFTVSPPVQIPLSFQLVNEDTCLIASFNPKDIQAHRFYRLRITTTMRNYSRLTLPNPNKQERTFFFEGLYPATTPFFSLSSHKNLDWGGRTIQLSGSCERIETIKVFFEKYPVETLKMYHINYGKNNWSISYPVNSAILREKTHRLHLIASIYFENRLLSKTIDLQLDLTPPAAMTTWPYADGMLLTNNSRITGIAGDNIHTSAVYARLDNAPWEQVNGTLNWTYSLNYSLTTNDPATKAATLHMAAIDLAGNSNYSSRQIIITNTNVLDQ